MIARCLDPTTNAEYAMHEVISLEGYKIHVLATDPHAAIQIAMNISLDEWEKTYEGSV
jgi:hypothetical protein